MALLDSFTAADGTALSARSGEGTDWSKIVGTGDMAIQTNRLHSSGVSDVYYVSTFVPSSADYDVVVPATQITAPAEYGQMFLGRADPAAHNYYAVRHVGFGVPRIQLLKRVAGAWTELGLAESTGTGELRLRMVGDQITVLVDGVVLIGPITDSSITAAGRVGFLSWAEVTATAGFHFDSVSHEAAGGSTATETLLANALLASSGFQAFTLADIDEDPDASDGAWAVATSNNTATSARVGFPTPSGNPTGVQTFKALIRQTSGSGAGTPKARIDLYENGTLLATGAENDIGVLVERTISQNFDLSGITLTDPTGAGVEARFVGTQSGGNPATRSALDLGAINWDVATYEVAGAQTHQLAGTSAGTSSTTGDLAVTHSLNGTSAGASTSTASLSVAQPLAGTSTGSSTTSGDLTVTKNLAGSSTGTSTTTGAVDVAHDLSGSSAGTSSTTGVLAVSVALTGTSAGSSSTTGSFTGVAIALTGDSMGTSTTSGTLSVMRSLSATSAGTSTTTGGIRVAIALSGTSAGLGTTTGSFSAAGAVALTGTSMGTSSTSGAVDVLRALVGVSAGLSTSTGALRLTAGFTGLSEGTSATSGALALRVGLTGVSTGSSSTSGEMGQRIVGTLRVTAVRPYATLTSSVTTPAGTSSSSTSGDLTARTSSSGTLVAT